MFSRSFRVLKKSIYKEKCGTSTNKRVKHPYQQIKHVKKILELEAFFLTFGITNILKKKMKERSQRTQQHDHCTKPLGKNKFT